MWFKHSFLMYLQRILPSAISPDTAMPTWLSILKTFFW